MPVEPIPCAPGGSGTPVEVQARRTQLDPGETWEAVAHPTLQSVTAVAHGGTGTITTVDGISILNVSEAATWSVGREADARVTGPLTITAGTGTVTITYTTGVTP